MLLLSYFAINKVKRWKILDSLAKKYKYAEYLIEFFSIC